MSNSDNNNNNNKPARWNPPWPSKPATQAVNLTPSGAPVASQPPSNKYVLPSTHPSWRGRPAPSLSSAPPPQQGAPTTPSPSLETLQSSAAGMLRQGSDEIIRPLTKTEEEQSSSSSDLGTTGEPSTIHSSKVPTLTAPLTSSSSSSSQSSEEAVASSTASAAGCRIRDSSHLDTAAQVEAAAGRQHQMARRFNQANEGASHPGGANDALFADAPEAGPPAANVQHQGANKALKVQQQHFGPNTSPAGLPGVAMSSPRVKRHGSLPGGMETSGQSGNFADVDAVMNGPPRRSIGGGEFVGTASGHGGGALSSSSSSFGGGQFSGAAEAVYQKTVGSGAQTTPNNSPATAAAATAGLAKSLLAEVWTPSTDSTSLECAFHSNGCLYFGFGTAVFEMPYFQSNARRGIRRIADLSGLLFAPDTHSAAGGGAAAAMALLSGGGEEPVKSAGVDCIRMSPADQVLYVTTLMEEASHQVSRMFAVTLGGAASEVQIPVPGRQLQGLCVTNANKVVVGVIEPWRLGKESLPIYVLRTEDDYDGDRLSAFSIQMAVAGSMHRAEDHWDQVHMLPESVDVIHEALGPASSSNGNTGDYFFVVEDCFEDASLLLSLWGQFPALLRGVLIDTWATNRYVGVASEKAIGGSASPRTEAVDTVMRPSVSDTDQGGSSNATDDDSTTEVPRRESGASSSTKNLSLRHQQLQGVGGARYRVRLELIMTSAEFRQMGIEKQWLKFRLDSGGSRGDVFEIFASYTKGQETSEFICGLHPKNALGEVLPWLLVPNKTSTRTIPATTATATTGSPVASPNATSPTTASTAASASEGLAASKTSSRPTVDERDGAASSHLVAEASHISPSISMAAAVEAATFAKADRGFWTVSGSKCLYADLYMRSKTRSVLQLYGLDLPESRVPEAGGTFPSHMLGDPRFADMQLLSSEGIFFTAHKVVIGTRSTFLHEKILEAENSKDRRASVEPSLGNSGSSALQTSSSSFSASSGGGDLAGSVSRKLPTICVPASTSAVRVLLTYLYTEQIPTQSEFTANADLLPDLLHVADLLDLPNLARRLERILIRHIDPQNVLNVYQTLHMLKIRKGGHSHAVALRYAAGILAHYMSDLGQFRYNSQNPRNNDHASLTATGAIAGETQTQDPMLSDSSSRLTLLPRKVEHAADSATTRQAEDVGGSTKLSSSSSPSSSLCIDVESLLSDEVHSGRHLRRALFCRYDGRPEVRKLTRRIVLDLPYEGDDSVRGMAALRKELTRVLVHLRVRDHLREKAALVNSVDGSA